jgi:cell division initiation protein
LGARSEAGRAFRPALASGVQKTLRLTPLDIQNHRFNTRWRGFDAAEVEAFVRLIAEDVESLVRERDKLRQQVRGLEARVEELSTNERTLQDTLVTAQAISDDLKKTAMKEAEVRISESEVKGEKIIDAAQRRAGRLAEDIREMRLLRSRLAGAIRGTIETHLALLEGLAAEDAEDEKRGDPPLAGVSRPSPAPSDEA